MCPSLKNVQYSRATEWHWETIVQAPDIVKRYETASKALEDHLYMTRPLFPEFEEPDFSVCLGTGARVL